MSRFLEVSDYFVEDLTKSNLTEVERLNINLIRDKLNSFEIVLDQKKWIQERRNKPGKQGEDNRNQDYDLFGIDLDAEVNIIESIDSKLLNYNYSIQSQNNIKSFELMQKFININIFSLFKKYKKLVIIFTVATILFTSFLMISGILGSFRESPFILCDSNGNVMSVGTTGINSDIDENNLAQYADKNLALNIFISEATKAGWTKQAIQGTLSYIMQEGSAKGTFTYENYYSKHMKGPGPNDQYGQLSLHLNNQDWLNWIDSEGVRTGQLGADKRNYAPHHYAIGIGLSQQSDVWDDGKKTWDGATRFIKAAEEAGKYWQDPVWQVQFEIQNILSKSSDPDFADPTTFSGSPEEYARRITTTVGMPAWHWTDNNKYMNDHIRWIEEAGKFIDNFSEVNGVTLGEATKIGNACQLSGNIKGSNASIAEAAVSYAHPNKEIATPNSGPNNGDGTDLYVKLVSQLEDTNTYYQSCDRSVATAVRWSGADDDFPMGATKNQLEYLKNSDRWVEVKPTPTSEEDGFLPGDIIIRQGHVALWTGNDLISKKWPGNPGNIVHGSIGDYTSTPPHLKPENRGPAADVFKQEKSMGGPYQVFRNIKTMENSKYKNLNN